MTFLRMLLAGLLLVSFGGVRAEVIGGADPAGPCKSNGTCTVPLTAPSYTVTAPANDPGIISPNGYLVINRTDTANYFPALTLRNGVVGVPHADLRPGTEIRFEGTNPSDGTKFTAGWFEVANYTDLGYASMTMMPNCGVESGCPNGTYSASSPQGPFLALGGLAIGGGIPPVAGGLITGGYSGSSLHDVPSLVANACDTWTFALTGAATNGVCSLGIPTALDPHLTVTCHIDSPGVVELHVCNHSGAVIDPASGTYYALVFNL